MIDFYDKSAISGGDIWGDRLGNVFLAFLKAEKGRCLARFMEKKWS